MLNKCEKISIMVKRNAKEGKRMTIDQAVQNFYRYNKIDPQNLEWYNDTKIERLAEKVELWSNTFKNDQNLFFRMLSCYTYLTNSEAVRRYQSAVEMLEKHLTKLAVDINDVLFVTVESSSATKCGSDNVRTDLHRMNIDKIDAQQIIASATRLSEEDMKCKSAIVFVDDIVSTGFTLWSTIKGFLSAFPPAQEKPLFFLCVVPTQSGVKYIRRKSREENLRITPVYKEEWVSISAFKHPSIFTEAEKTEVQLKIQKYEELIDSYMKEQGKSYRFGFRESKQLVSFYYNTPNNTLCTFWRQTDAHVPLFRRQKQPRPSLSDLQGVKKRKDDCAYLINKEIKEKA